MSHTLAEPQLTTEGVAFTVRVDSINRDCFISNEALAKLSRQSAGEASPIDTFRAFEANINGVARRMVAANVPGNPLKLGPDSFH
ncbi:DUF1488 family protein [Noviherbaspirillum sp.]|uniref:DUF1488 family protein n=1 Tax=Noviherbaspirillum sp. TaxID=1926288 RepID=UPI002FE1D543